MKADPWPHILGLMGKEGERAMIDLLLDCGIFLVVGSGRGTYHQLSGESDTLKSLAPTNEKGHPLGDLQSIPTKPPLNSNARPAPKTTARSPPNITLVRNRMMHARAALNKQGEVRFGLRHIRENPRFPGYSLLIT
jgi:telomerase reverse transcriptase